jgi:glycosyltransferase involved in cell wall biosynthesis
VLHRIFSGIDPRDYCLISFGGSLRDTAVDIEPLPAATHRLLPRCVESEPVDFRFPSWRVARRLFTEVTSRARALARVADEEGCRAILVTSGGTPDPLVALMVSRWKRLPLFVHMFDHWRYQFASSRLLLRATAVIEPMVIRRAAGVIVPNEGLGLELERRYGCPWAVVRNPVEDAAFSVPSPKKGVWPEQGAPIRIVYTGQVYAAQLDAIVALLKALESPDLQDVELNIFSASSSPEAMKLLSSDRFAQRVRLHPFVPPPMIYEIQRNADILLLPLAFDSPYPEIIRGATPTKLGDYLATGAPVLAICPADAFLAEFLRRKGCGLVVDQPDPAAIAAAIRRLRDEPNLRRDLGRNGRAVAEREFRADNARRALSDFIGERIEASPHPR